MKSNKFNKNQKTLIGISLIILIFFAIFLIFNNTIKKDTENNEKEIFDCSDESRNAEACIEIYEPVCGWFNSSRIQCIKYPCAQAFSNSCFACQNPDVEYYTKGECPR